MTQIRSSPGRFSAPVPFLAFLVLLMFITSAAGGAIPLVTDDSTGGSSTISTDPARKVIFLFVPLNLIGDHRPIGAADLQKSLEAAIEQSAPAVDLVIANPTDSRCNGQDLSSPLSAEIVRAIARNYGAPLVGWGSIQFSNEVHTIQAGAGSVVFMYQLTETAQADVKIQDTASGEILVDQPMVQINNMTTRAPIGTGPFVEDESSLAVKCVNDLAANLVKAIRDRINKLSR